ncbi:acid phosphatase type 7-like [Cimex lectularius]|uniref:Purple acid phosphatase n=1 Tax=Cimex lectularius TaxID=79782 RepID=A0A8I6S7D9_CIMLE|nr:acid phosphatase type 7-like [Cimex lectularius]
MKYFLLVLMQLLFLNVNCIHRAGHIRYHQPEQIHIAFGDSVSEILITWSTITSTPNSIVEYGVNDLNERAEGSAKRFVDGGPEARAQYIHRVKLTNLRPLTKYLYHCGSHYGWSEEFWFKTVDNETNWSPRLAVYGDMGNINARSLPRLQEETQHNKYDAIIHVGDLAYDMRDDNGRMGDQFMRQLQPIAAYVPYMVCPGNHEEAYNFSHFRERFSMPGQNDNLYYSFNLGPIHFISLTTETYYYIEYGLRTLVNQYQWLLNDLKEANLPENRAKRPWIITYGHKPMYCSDRVVDDCKEKDNRVRKGIPLTKWFGLENLFYKYGVDLHFSGHRHSYERMYPVYDYIVKKGSKKKPYYNPEAPVHIITGSAGCQESMSNFTDVPPPWSAFRSSNYGFTVLEVYNSSHLHVQQIAVDFGDYGEVIDDVWIVKTKHQYNKNYTPNKTIMFQ